jgi:hypothetical protein
MDSSTGKLIVAMGSPLSPVIANFYMEDYKKVALESAPLKPAACFTM